MKLKLSLLVLAQSLAPLFADAYAGQDVGNGGDVVVCRSGSGYQSVELLDYYEGRIWRNWQVDLPNGTPVERARAAFQRLERLDPERSRRYLEHLASFCDEAVFIPANIELPDINDSGYVPMPLGCSVSQAAIQREPRAAFDRRYQISSLFWGQACQEGAEASDAVPELDESNMAGLIMHEIVYRDALERGHKNSIQVRYLTGLIASSAISAMSFAEYREMLRAIDMDVYIFYMNWGDHTGLLRFFSNERQTHDEATAFCDDLPGFTRLAELQIMNSNYSAFITSPMGEAILRLAPEQQVFVNGGDYIDESHQPIKIVKFQPTSMRGLALPSPEMRLPFLCRSERP